MKNTSKQQKAKTSALPNGSNAEAEAVSKRRPFSQDFSGPSLTQQHFTAQVDVNNIVNHFRVTGIDPYADRIPKQKFGFASSVTFEEALRQTAEVKSAFAELPSEKRGSFNNDPALWLDSLVIDPTPTIDETPIVDPAASQPPAEPPTEPKPAEMDST